MTYSSKRYGFAMAAVIAILAVTFVLRFWLQPPHMWLWAMAMGAAGVGLGFFAYFSRDEIQRQNRMRAWYWGGALAIMLILLPFVLIVSNAMLEAMAGLLPHPASVPEMARYSPKLYFSLGIMATLTSQLIGNYFARIVLWFRS